VRANPLAWLGGKAQERLPADLQQARLRAHETTEPPGLRPISAFAFSRPGKCCQCGSACSLLVLLEFDSSAAPGLQA
jgi:hypothetical protein